MVIVWLTYSWLFGVWQSVEVIWQLHTEPSVLLAIQIHIHEMLSVCGTSTPHLATEYSSALRKYITSTCVRACAS